MSDPLSLPPLRSNATFNWSAVGQKGDRSSSEFGGSGMSDAFASLFRGAVPGTGGRQPFTPRGATAAGGIPQATAGIGKTDVRLTPSGYQPSNKPLPKAPLKAPGFAEGLLGGLVGVLTGFLPQDIKNTIVGGAQTVGSLLDVPLELVGHIPVNQLVGLENTEGAFNLLPMSAEKRHVMEQIQADSINRAYYMTQYVRLHQDEYLAAKGLPQILGNIAMPDQTIMERFMGLLGIPGQLVGRTLAGNGRAMEVINAPGVIQNESLRTIRERYMAGEYGPPGSQQAIDRMTDVLVSSGLTFSDNPFFELVAELATDPFTWVGGLGVAAKVVQVGALARRAANISRVARAAGAAGDATVAGLVERVDALAAAGATEAPLGLRSAGSTSRWANTFEREAGAAGKSLIQKAESELSLRDQAQVAMQPVIETLAKGSEIANSAFGLFGVDRAAANMLQRFARTSAQGSLAAFGIEKVHDVYQGIRATGQSADGLNEALSYSLAHAQRALAQNSLIKQLRTNLKDMKGRFLPADWMPDALTDPTKVVDEIRKGNPMEAQQIETLLRRVKKQVVPKVDQSLTGDARKVEYERQMDVFREEGAQQLAYAAKIDISTARNILRKADSDTLALVDWAHWGRTLKDFEANKALDVAGAQGLADTSIAAARAARRETEAIRTTTGEAIAEQGPLVRATLVGPSDLTLQQAERLLKAIEDAPDEAAAMRLAEQAINNKEFLYQNLYQKVRVTSDADIISRVKVLLEDGIKNKRFVSVLEPDSLPTHLKQFREELHARGAQYEIGVAPSADRRWAPVIDPKSGHLVGYYPWIEHSVTPSAMTAPTRFDIFRERIWQPVRAENILTESRRTFIQMGAKTYHLDKASAQTVFDAIRAKAIENRVGMRAFSEDEFRNILNTTNIPAETKALLGARGLAELTAKALEGDVRQVGVTTKLSGISKTQTARYGNYLGQLSEKVYPLVRFNLNPFFIMQEWVEPLFFNILRGVKLGIKYSEEDIRFHKLMDEWNMGAVLADGFESREFVMQGAVLAHEGMGPQTRIGRLVSRMADRTGMSRMHDVKKHNYVFGTKTEFGRMFHRSMDERFPGQWPRIEAFFNDLDVRTGGKGRLSEGEIATRWFMNKGMYDPDSRTTAINHYDGAIPDQLGRVVGIRRSHVAARFGFESGEAMRAAIMDPTSGMDEWQVRNTLVQNGFTPEYAERAWQVASGITPEEMYASIRNDYPDPVEGNIAAGMFSRWVDYAATLKGISPEEYIARKFTSASVWLDGSARLPYNAYTQLMRGLAEEFHSDLMEHGGWEWIERDDPRYQRVQTRLDQLWPDAPHPTQSAHRKAAVTVRDQTTVAGMNGAISKPIDIHGVKIDPGLTMNPEQASVWAATQRERMSDAEITGAGGWYPEIGPGFLSYYMAVPDAELLSQARLMNQHMTKAGIKPIDLDGSIDDIREEVTARAIMAWSSTQIQTSPKAGFGFVLRAMDENARGRRPDAAKGYGYDIQTEQVRRMLLDFEQRLSIEGFAAKLHDFTDSNLVNRRRTFMPDATYIDRHGVEQIMQPGAMDIWMGRARGFVDKETLNYLAARIEAAEGLTPEKALLEAQKRTNVWLKVPEGVEGATKVWSGSPSPQEYEAMLLYYNRLKDELNDMEDGRGWLNKQWTVADIQAVEWVSIQRAVGLEAGGPGNMFGDHATTIQYQFDPGKHIALREMGLDRLPESARDYVIRTVDTEMRRIVQEETGVTFVRYQPGWQNTTDGVVSANSTWSIIGKPEQIDDALHILSLLTQNGEIVGTRQAEAGALGISRTGVEWGIDFTPALDGADPVVMELLRIWLDGESRAGSFAARGSTNAMRSDMRGAVRVLFEDVPKKSDLAAFEAHTPLTPQMIASLEDGSWVKALRPEAEAIPVSIDRRLMTVQRVKNDYDKDFDRAAGLIRKGADADTTYAAEMGKGIQSKMMADVKKRQQKIGPDGKPVKGADGKPVMEVVNFGPDPRTVAIRGRVVDRHLPSIRNIADSAAQHADSKTWAAGRGRIQFLQEGGGGTRIYYQRNPRGWRAATQWNRRRDTAVAVADGRLGGSRGTLYFKRGRVDVTSPVHEFYHFFADDLDPSAISAIHTLWWDSLTDQQRAVRTKPAGDATVLEREAEEWIAPQFEEYSATGILPDMDANLNAVFNAYKGAWDTINKGRQASVNPEIARIFDTMTPEIHRGPQATFDVNQFRMMEAGRIALQRAEEEMFRVHFFKRGRNVLERSINHPYLGLYPASYMWGKVLPELMRFLVKKPFGIDAPFLGMQMANHVWNAIQLEMNTDNSPIANLILEYPEAVRFLQLMVPGTPWDIPVNAPAWARRLSAGEWQGQSADIGSTLTDTLGYMFGPGRAPSDLAGFLAAGLGTAQRVGQMVAGQYETPEQRQAREQQQAQQARTLYRGTPRPTPQTPFLVQNQQQ